MEHRKLLPRPESYSGPLVSLANLVPKRKKAGGRFACDPCRARKSAGRAMSAFSFHLPALFVVAVPSKGLWGSSDALSRREDLKPPKETHSAALLRTNQDGSLELGTNEFNATWTVRRLRL
ncbi:hypothetical protein QBC46DRAFT_393020 [Diplogelasinospora grovesii]|uniref:Uncharacterized protein n=1 Tax=Diplogelasinospora grovesii TaxID=303347 RepID=A0AAN6S1Q6_9PEZI|nr:hypothetical protein QBC46DRAFT_393020 [Diplogelasinospora grovesii]